MIRFAPDGRVFVASKSGIINVFDSLERHDADAVRRPAHASVHDYWDRGLLGHGARPAASRPGGRTSTCSTPTTRRRTRRSSRAGATAARRRPAPTADGCVISGRLSRLSATGAETVLIEDFCQQYPSHSVGLDRLRPRRACCTSSAGDGASFNWADYGQDGSPVNPCGDPPARRSRADVAGRRAALAELPPPGRRRPSTLDGAILRVNPDTGAAAAGNPAIGDADPNRRRIVAYGFRNPFRFTFRPGHGRDLVRRRRLEHVRGDQPHAGHRAGPQLRLAVLRGRAADGLLRRAEPRQLRDALQRRAPARSPRRTSPTTTPRRSSPGESCTTGSSSISGLAFYTGDAFPARLPGRAVLQRLLAQLHLGHVPRAPNGLPDLSDAPDVRWRGADGPVWLTQGPDGALYYADLVGRHGAPDRGRQQRADRAHHRDADLAASRR